MLVAAAFAQVQSGYSIEGRMIDDLRGEPVHNVRLLLSGGMLKDPLVAKTNAQGKFGFSVPEGRYQIDMEKAGFFAFPPEAVEVRGAATNDLGDIVLTSKRTISGTVTWRNGEPVADTLIVAFPVKEVRTVPSVPFVTRTDDRGVFRTEALPPGRYSLGPLTLELEGGRAIAPVFYPINVLDVAEYSTASIVFEERTGVDIEGKVLVSPNVPAGARVTISLKAPGSPRYSSIMASSRAGETFRLAKVPSGLFQAVAVNQSAIDVQYGIQSIEVGSSPIHDWTIAIPKSVPLTGTVEIEQAGQSAPAPNVDVWAYSAKFDLRTIGRSGPAGEFRVSATLGGESYQLTLDSVCADCYIASVKQSERTVTLDPFLVNTNGEVIRIVLKKDGGKITGQLPPKGVLAKPAFVVLAPRDRRATNFFRTASTDRKRAFQLSGIAPGAYDLFAFDQENDYLGEESLLKYAARAVAVDVMANATLSVALEIANRR
jgi:hypothetical protein